MGNQWSSIQPVLDDCVLSVVLYVPLNRQMDYIKAITAWWAKLIEMFHVKHIVVCVFRLLSDSDKIIFLSGLRVQRTQRIFKKNQCVRDEYIQQSFTDYHTVPLVNFIKCLKQIDKKSFFMSAILFFKRLHFQFKFMKGKHRKRPIINRYVNKNWYMKKQRIYYQSISNEMTFEPSTY